MSRWFLLFVLMPIGEMYLLFQVGDYIGALPTIGLVMLTAMIGIFLLRRQGLATLTRGMQRLEAGQMPASEMAEGLLLAVAGALLLTPGFVTDTIGFVLLTPPLRRQIAAYLIDRAMVVGVAQRGGQARNHPPRGSGPSVIDGEYERKD